MPAKWMAASEPIKAKITVPRGLASLILLTLFSASWPALSNDLKVRTSEITPRATPIDAESKLPVCEAKYIALNIKRPDATSARKAPRINKPAITLFLNLCPSEFGHLAYNAQNSGAFMRPSAFVC